MSFLVANRMNATLPTLAVSMLLTTAVAQEIQVVNPLFSNVLGPCPNGYAYQSFGGNCSSYIPQQTFDRAVGMGWIFAPATVLRSGDGITGPNTQFEPPSFEGLPFNSAVFFEGPNTGVFQPIFGLVAGTAYRLSFYLGSRYATGVYEGTPYDGNQTIAALIDDHPIGHWTLVSYTPFTLETRLFEVSRNGPHVLTFVGLAASDSTAFLSGVTINAVR